MKLSCAMVCGALWCAVVRWPRASVELGRRARLLCAAASNTSQKKMRDAMRRSRCSCKTGTEKRLKGKSSFVSQGAADDDGWSRPRSAKCDCAAQCRWASSGESEARCGTLMVRRWACSCSDKQRAGGVFMREHKYRVGYFLGATEGRGGGSAKKSACTSVKFGRPEARRYL